MNDKISRRIWDKVQFAYNVQMTASKGLGCVSDDDVMEAINEGLPSVSICELRLPNPSSKKVYSDPISAVTIYIDHIDSRSPFYTSGEIELRALTRYGYLSGLTLTELYLYTMAYRKFGRKGADAMASYIIYGSGDAK